MTRWKPDARQRLEQAAYELYLERGYDLTTVAEIAERAGLTERTFFRHYADKREVLFGGSEELKSTMVDALAAAPSELGALPAVRIAIEAVSRLFHGRHDDVRRRSQLISAHPVLRERALIKRAALTAALAEALERRDVPKPTASILAEMGIAVFYLAFDEWVDEARDRELIEIVGAGFDQLRAAAR